ncbi:serine O-acetyltransferase EpsC [Opitutus terrae]|uniref:Serine O-acetyltransferase n=1 Tax=Opitutus terrae (strain DSM 11246 / JCM 15787 / PB90-1) TaxID=452637 RepID=B1ZSB0_OPITP|nr:serine O-acetyltransferase EpsC [Opitutus terrae]ACB75709.1 Serine O-acetyltransferase [Opitutus terrae PB90-1]
MSLDDIQQALLASYAKHGGINHLDGVNLPAQSSVNQLAVDCMHLLFPGFFENSKLTKEAVGGHVAKLLTQLDKRLESEIEKCLRFSGIPGPASSARQLTTKILTQLPALREVIQTDVAAAYRGDPAARSIEEIILAYPCVLVISLQRFAHELYRAGVPLLPRMITEFAHERTGCDLHPGARIGSHFFIDHCTGVVIGETATIGHHVKLYQGVTLGAKSFETDEAGDPIKGVKRHPDIGDHVTIYANATILGGDTQIGENSIIGSNVWLIKSVPADSVVYNKGENLVTRSRRQKEALIENPSHTDLRAYDWQI